MTTDALQKLLAAKPFRPFTLHMANGSDVAVRHPEFTVTSPGGRTLVVFTSAEGEEWIDLLLVSHASLGERPRSRRRRAS